MGQVAFTVTSAKENQSGPLTWSIIAYEAKQMLDTSQVYKGPTGSSVKQTTQDRL